MLSRLRSPDGTKRRRRKEQPVYTQRRRRRLTIGLVLGITTLVLAGWYGFRFFQRLRLEGETFREGVNRRTSEAVGCQVEFTRIHDGGDSSLSAVECRFDTRNEDILASGTLFGINADLTGSSWVSSEWGIKQLSITRGMLTFDPQRIPSAADNMKIMPRAAGREKSKDGFRFSIDPEPDIITLDLIRFTGGLDMEWPSGAGDRKPETIRGLRGHAKLPDDGEIEGAFAGGTIVLKQWPEMRLEQFQWTLKERRLGITGAQIVIGSGEARAAIAGHADLIKEGSLDLKVTIESSLLKFFLPAAWQERVGGLFSTKDASFRAAFGKGPERKFEGDFTLEGGVLRGMGFINKLADSLQRRALSPLEFPQLTGHFAWSPSSGMEITNLAGDKEGLLRLAGDVKVNAAGVVSGRLKASASEIALSDRTVDHPHPFGSVADGWASVEFNLSGSATLVNDDLVLPGYSAPRVPGPVPESPAPAKDDLEKQFNDLLPR